MEKRSMTTETLATPPTEKNGVIQSAIEANKRNLIRIALHFGKHVQHEKFIEEMAELMVEIKHMYKGFQDDAPTTSGFIEELADVIIVAEQVKFLLNSHESYCLASSINKKIDRTMKRIEQEKRNVRTQTQ